MALVRRGMPARIRKAVIPHRVGFDERQGVNFCLRQQEQQHAIRLQRGERAIIATRRH